MLVWYDNKCDLLNHWFYSARDICLYYRFSAINLFILRSRSYTYLMLTHWFVVSDIYVMCCGLGVGLGTTVGRTQEGVLIVEFYSMLRNACCVIRFCKILFIYASIFFLRFNLYVS